MAKLIVVKVPFGTNAEDVTSVISGAAMALGTGKPDISITDSSDVDFLGKAIVTIPLERILDLNLVQTTNPPKPGGECTFRLELSAPEYAVLRKMAEDRAPAEKGRKPYYPPFKTNFED